MQLLQCNCLHSKLKGIAAHVLSPSTDMYICTYINIYVSVCTIELDARFVSKTHFQKVLFLFRVFEPLWTLLASKLQQNAKGQDIIFPKPSVGIKNAGV